MKTEYKPEALTTYRARNIITIPAEAASELALQVGENFIVEWDKIAGTITLIRAKVIPAEDAWYHTPKMKAAMAESMDDLAAGRVEIYLTDEDFLASLGD